MTYDTYVKRIRKENIEQMPEYKVNKYFYELIRFLPNNGKLYKYRSFDKEKIDLYIDALREKYIWIPSASEMCDIKDSALNIKLEKDVDEFEKYIKENPYLLFKILLKNKDMYNMDAYNFKKKTIDEFINCVDDDGKINKNKALSILLKNGIKLAHAKEKIEKIDSYVRECVDNNKEALKQFVDKLMDISDRQRENTNIFSMCERHDNNSLWINYSKNDGFCIEYDFKKAISMSAEIKRKLLLTLKVKYYEELKRFSIFKFLKAKINDEKKQDFYNEQLAAVFEQLLSKEKCYSAEEEWRIIQYKSDNKMYADLVSSIIIDEKGLDNDKSKDIIRCAQRNNWKIMIRKYDRYNSDYYYSEYV